MLRANDNYSILSEIKPSEKNENGIIVRGYTNDSSTEYLVLPCFLLIFHFFNLCLISSVQQLYDKDIYEYDSPFK